MTQRRRHYRCRLCGRVLPAWLTAAKRATPATPTDPALPVVERKDIQQWTVRLSKALIEHLKTVAYEAQTQHS